MMFTESQDFFHRFASAQAEADVAHACRMVANALGFDAFIYAYRLPTSFAESRVAQISGYPAGWLERYWAEGYYAVDPVIAYCSHNVLPVSWHELIPRASAVSLRMMNEASECGLSSGISMPVHGPRGELGILSFAQRSASSQAQTAIERARPLVHMLAAHVHAAVHRVVGVQQDEPPPRLSAREQECLRWASDGKTSWEIAMILGISERTVNFHIDNAAIKLKAVNRQHALAKAIALRTISPRPF